MRFWRILIALVVLVAPLRAQVDLASHESLRSQVRSSISQVADGTNGKCGTAYRMTWRSEHLEGSSGVGGVWDVRPIRQASRLSTSGRFRVHYDTTGGQEPALLSAGGVRMSGTSHAFADSVMNIFDHAWTRIVDGLGYEPPPVDTAGGDSAYDIYISGLPPNWFGQTVLESPLPGSSTNERWVSYIEIDNDFAGLRTSGMAGLRITAAHEFFHAIQIGSYGVWDAGEFYFYELSSVWMETILEPTIEDYLFDLPEYFASFSGMSFAALTSTFRGYERSIFALFLEHRFDRNVLRDTWSTIRERRVLSALDEALSRRGSSLKDAFREFALWNHRTSDRATSAPTYLQASRFPRMAPAASVVWSPPAQRFASSVQPLSHSTFDLRMSSDTISTILINADVAAAQQQWTTSQSVAVEVATSRPEGGGQQVGGLWITSEVVSPERWYSDVVSAVRRGSLPPDAQRPWPSPWVLSENADLVLPAGEIQQPESVEFISSGNAVTRVHQWIDETQRALHVTRIPVASMRDRLSSGVYVVVLRRGADRTLWKVAVVR